jgi:hypothetical protein
MKFNSPYLSFIDEEIIQRLNLESLNFGKMSEEIFEIKYQKIVLLNALTQCINITYKDFLLYVIEKEKTVPSAIIIKILENQDIDLIKDILDKKIAIYDIEHSNLFEQNQFPQIFFQRLDQVPETTKVREKNNFLTHKQIIYYLYKSEEISKVKRDNIIKELASVIHLNKNEILTSIIKMKDQDLAEELIMEEDFMFDDEALSTSMIMALKFNQPRVAL